MNATNKKKKSPVKSQVKNRVSEEKLLENKVIEDSEQEKLQKEEEEQKYNEGNKNNDSNNNNNDLRLLFVLRNFIVSQEMAKSD